MTPCRDPRRRLVTGLGIDLAWPRQSKLSRNAHLLVVSAQSSFLRPDTLDVLVTIMNGCEKASG